MALGTIVTDLFEGLPDHLQVVVFFLVLIFWMLTTVGVLLLWIKRIRLQQKVAQVTAARDEAREEVEGFEQRLDKAMDVEDPWRVLATVARPFVSKADREVRIGSVINLKGGVGKTTLVTNLAACIAQRGDLPRDILVVDLDFQGTLSAGCVDGDVYAAHQNCSNTAGRLLEEGLSANSLPAITARMNGVPGAHVITASDALHRVDTREQARFIIDPTREVRFRYARLFHSPAVASKYSLILFDCPPRLTASCVNALACSDFVVIPTKLDDKSIDAISRTLKWLEHLNHIVSAKVLGIVPNEVMWHGGKPQVHHADGYLRLKTAMEEQDCGDAVFASMVRLDKRISAVGPGVVPSRDAQARELFDGVVDEFLKKL